MSLYNRLFGENPDAMALLGMIGTTRNDFQRYRDVNLNKDGNIIIVTTRLGGENRDDYKQVFTNMRRNENYIKDFDDDLDCTYCYFYFKVPEKYLHTTKMMAPEEEPLSVGKKFEKEIEEAKVPGSPAYKRQEEIGKWIMENIILGNTTLEL